VPVSFELEDGRPYFIARWVGSLTVSEIEEAYESFFEGPQWHPDLNELTDLSRADVSTIPSAEAQRFVSEMADFYRDHGVASVRNAVYAPSALPHGLAIVYADLADGPPEHVRVCKSIEDAIAWVEGSGVE
jgi:hypothetical protein